MCKFGNFGTGHCFYRSSRPGEAAFGPRPVWYRPRVDEEVRYWEECKRDLEQELAEVTDRLKTLKNQD